MTNIEWKKRNINKMMNAVNEIHDYSSRLGTLGMIRSDYGQKDYFEDEDVKVIRKAAKTVAETYNKYFKKPYEEEAEDE